MSMNKPDLSVLMWELERDLCGGLTKEMMEEMTEIRVKHALSQMENAIKERSGMKFMGVVKNSNRALHLLRNAPLLREHGMYESALVYTYTSGHAPVDGWPLLFSMADRERLRKCGDPLPHAGPFMVFRGVAGRGRQRAVKHYSWTGTLDCARWFAGRASYIDSLPDPAVFVVTVLASEVLFYTNNRDEDEYVLSTETLRPRRLERVTKEQFDEIVNVRGEKGMSELKVMSAEGPKELR
jgi:hypothetical protein